MLHGGMVMIGTGVRPVLVSMVSTNICMSHTESNTFVNSKTLQ